MQQTKPIAQSNNFIILDKYTKIDQDGSSYQSEADLENELIKDLTNHSFDFTMNWAKSDNRLIKDLKDFTATFLQKKSLLDVLINYCVLDVSDTLLIMRPYQIAATERLIWKVKSSYEAKKWSSIEGGGFIWHTTGSGKTLTSFKAARLATQLEFIEKVFFVVDRKDLDYQTMKEYQRFSPNSVNGSNSTAGLKENINLDLLELLYFLKML